jgi:hypothetical protein
VTGKQIFGLRNVVSLEKDIGIIFLQSLDQMTSYRIVNDIKNFIREYGALIGGGGMSNSSSSTEIMNTLRHFLKTIPDFYTATEDHYKAYNALVENFMPPTKCTQNEKFQLKIYDQMHVIYKIS